MEFNAFVLDWTMNDFPLLKAELSTAGFAFEKVDGEEHLRVAVPFERLAEAAALLQSHLDVPFNYVDVQFPMLKMTVIVFQQRMFTITNREENEAAIQWAIGQGLPVVQADWGTSF